MAGMKRHAFGFARSRNVIDILGPKFCVFEHRVISDAGQFHGIALPDAHHVARQPGFLAVFDLEQRRLDGAGADVDAR